MDKMVGVSYGLSVTTNFLSLKVILIVLPFDLKYKLSGLNGR